MPRFLRTRYRTLDPERSRALSKALGLEFRREPPIVREGKHEATNHFFACPGEEVELELTWNTDGRTYDNGTGYGHIAIGVDDMAETLASLKERHGIEPERPPYRIREGDSLLCFVRDPDGSLPMLNRDRMPLVDGEGRLRIVVKGRAERGVAMNAATASWSSNPVGRPQSTR